MGGNVRTDTSWDDKESQELAGDEQSLHDTPSRRTPHHHSHATEITAQTKSIDRESKHHAAEDLADDHTDIHTPGYMARDYKKDQRIIRLFYTVFFLCVTTVIFLVYYYAIRMPNSIYADASAKTGVLLTNVKKITYDTAKWPLVDTTSAVTVVSAKVGLAAATPDSESVQKEKIDDALKNIQQYNKTLDLLATNKAVKEDSTVHTAYEAAAQKLQTYGTVYASIIESQNITRTLLSTCTSIEFTNITTLDDYDKATECLSLIRQHPTVPLKDMSTQVYEPLTALLQKMLTEYQRSVDALQKNNVAQYKNFTAMIAKNAETLEELETEFDNYRISAPSAPTSTLSTLKTTIENRQNVIVR